ncbi:cubilin-like [Ptychodera flava]|uniref:cubilin-like n=1 Tax=Ptychodera flava TaxID=63121 RepID=UPI003969C628
MQTKLAAYFILSIWMSSTCIVSGKLQDIYSNREVDVRHKRWLYIDTYVSGALECPSDEFIYEGGSVSVVSPGYPGHSVIDGDCVTTVRTTYGSTFLVIFQKFEVFWGDYVTFEPLAIVPQDWGLGEEDGYYGFGSGSGSGSGSGDGDLEWGSGEEETDEGPEPKQYSLHYLPGYLLAFKTPELKIRFVEGQFGEYSSFHFSIVSVPTVPCGVNNYEDLQEGDGVIVESYGYPYPYPRHTDCSTKVKARPGLTLRVQVLDFDLECGCCDFLSIDEYSYMCDKTSLPNVMYLTSDEVTFRLRTDGTGQRRGFQLLVTAGYYTPPSATTKVDICDGEFTVEPGRELAIALPEYASQQGQPITCSASVLTQAGAKLHYEIVDFGLTCCCGEVEVDGAILECGENYFERAEVSTDSLSLSVTTEGTVEGNGFVIRVWAEDNPIQICGGEFMLMPNEEIVITSPNYPSNYDAGENCVTTVTAPEGALINVQVTHFDVECCCDHLTLNDVEQTCDDYFRERTTLSSNQLVVSFISDSSAQYSGYTITVSAEIPDTTSCAASYTLEIGEELVISSPNYPSAYNADEECVTTVDLPELTDGIVAYIQVLHFVIECCCDHLEINDVPQDCDNYYNERTAVTTDQVVIRFTSDGSMQFSGFSLKLWTETPDTDSCAASYTLEIGEELVISSPNYPSEYNADEECVTTVDLPELREGNVAYVQILHFDIECCCDHLEINDVLQTCDNYYNERSAVTTDQVVIRFTSDSSMQFSGFSLKLWTEIPDEDSCATSHTLDIGEELVVSSPNYPSEYNAGEECVTTVNLPELTEGIEAYVQVLHFDVECCCDHLEINGDTQYCDNYDSERTAVTTDQVVIRFISDGSVQYSGFSLKVWTEIPDTGSCSASHTLMIGEELVISSPNYPSEYNADEECVTTVDLPDLTEDIKAYVQVLYLNIECCCDVLEINDVLQNCDNYYSEKTEVTTDQVVIRFTSDGSVQYSGFSLKVWTETQNTRSCATSHTLEIGEELIISSPNYPSEYNANEECVTTVDLPELTEGLEAYIQVVNLNIECCCDVLEINDVPQNCDSYYSERTELTTDQVVIRFTSDGSVQYSGFSLKVWTEMPDTTSCTTSHKLEIGEELVISSPNYPSEYNADEKCVTTVDLPDVTEGLEAYIQVVDFNIECCCDVLEINDVLQNCDNYYSERTKVTGDQVVIQFTSDGSVQYSGFSLKVWTGNTSCAASQTLEIGEELVISSPNYPSEYNAGEECVTTVDLPELTEGFVAYIQVLDFTIECCCDQLEINDVLLNCDNYYNEKTEVTTDQVVIRFTSDGSVQFSGFSLKVWTEIPNTTSCAASHTLEIGEELVISSPNYPSEYNADEECVTTVDLPELPEGIEVYVQVLYLNIECCCDHLEINDIAQECNNYYSERTELTTDQVVIRFTSDGSAQYSGFNLKIWTEMKTEGKPGCGEHVSLEAGHEVLLTSPNYPEHYNEYAHCERTVVAPPGSKLYYQITDFDTECCCDPLTINGVTVECEGAMSDPAEEPSNRLEVIFTSDGSVAGTGFSMRVWADEALDVTTLPSPTEPTVDPALVEALGRYGLAICLDHGTIGIRCAESLTNCITAENLCDGHRDCTWDHPLLFNDEDPELCQEPTNEISLRRSVLPANPGEEVLVQVLKYLDDHVIDNFDEDEP